jgi:hypothetical protein
VVSLVAASSATASERRRSVDSKPVLALEILDLRREFGVETIIAASSTAG